MHVHEPRLTAFGTVEEVLHSANPRNMKIIKIEHQTSKSIQILNIKCIDSMIWSILNE